MAVSDPKDTLAYQTSRPLMRARSLAHTPAAYAAERIQSFMGQDSEPGTRPETEALWFYGMNHAMAEVQKAKAPYEPLGDLLPFVEAYHRELGPKAVRAFYYLILICTREARHLKNKQAMQAQLATVYGKKAVDYLGVVPDHPTQAMEVFCTSPPACRLGEWTGLLSRIFYQGTFSPGYGGPNWGKVADCLHRFVTGELTTEMMLDVVWTLSHNNGPIFNKGMLYGAYTNQLMRILDVQRSGQVPELVRSGTLPGYYAPTSLVQWMNWLRAEFPDAVGDYVDWFVVEALGSVNKYPSEKQAQVAEHGLPPSAQKAELAAKAAQEAKAAAEAQAKLEHAKKHFLVMPGLEVQKIARSA